MSPAARHRDGQLRLDSVALAPARIAVTVGRGRVELGRAPGPYVRVRWTVPALLPDRWPQRLRRGGPRVRSDALGLRLRVRRARLRIDLPDGFGAAVTLGRGEITSWGAGGDLVLHSPAGRVSCRELTSRSVLVRAEYANLHFAAIPQRVEVSAPDCVLALPAAGYAVSAPDGAEIEVDQAPESARQIIVSGGAARILVAKPPIRLRSEPTGNEAAGG